MNLQQLNDETPGALSGAGQPAWLSELRVEALRALREHPAPARDQERWRLTDLALLAPEQYRLARTAALAAATLPAPTALDHLRPRDLAGELTLFNGAHGRSSLAETARRAGVVSMPLELALLEHAPALRPHFAALAGAGDHVTARSLALVQGGAYLRIPAGLELAAPLQVTSWFDAPGIAVHPRTVIVVEPGARVAINDVYASPARAGQGATLVAPTVELFVGQGAEVHWLTWQAWGALLDRAPAGPGLSQGLARNGPGVRQVANLRAQVARGAHLQAAVVSTAGELCRTETRVELVGDGASAELLGAYLPATGEQVEHWTLQDHQAPRTRSELTYLGALVGRGRSLYYGTIRVRPGAFGTDAYQQNRNLLLSPGARADTNPQLEIETDDVRCTHGATVGPIDEEQLFYLTSRGIPRGEAERLLVRGFLGRVLDRLERSGLRETVTRALVARARREREVSGDRDAIGAESSDGA